MDGAARMQLAFGLGRLNGIKLTNDLPRRLEWMAGSANNRRL